MNKKNINEYDWRLQAITTIVEDTISPTGKPIKKGTPVILLHPLKINNRRIEIYTPSPIAMFLNLSNNYYQNSLNLFNFKEFKDPRNYNEEQLFNSLECYMASIIFAYTAVETFSNYSIPNNYEFKKLREDKKCLETYDKEEIEKNIKLDLKIDCILSGIYKVSTFKGTFLWENYLSLKKIRDRIIHLKSKDTKYDLKDPCNHLWNDLINNGELINYTKKAKEIIEYFYSDKKPRWLIKCPF